MDSLKNIARFKMKWNSIRWYKLALFAALGGIGGFAYYYFIGCVGNACPITSNPYISTAYGFGVGVLMGWDKGTIKDDKQETE